jgi:thiamine biosynthesis lipoprotein
MRFFCWFLCIPAFALAQRQEFFHPQMGTLFQVSLYGVDSSQGKAIAAQVFARIDSLNARFSDYVENSEINRLSATSGSGQKIKVSRDMWNLIAIAQRVSRRSNGAFDLSIGPLSKIWRRAFRQMQFPDTLELAKAKTKVNYRFIKRYPFSRKIQLLHPGMRLDAGGIAKGFAVDAGIKLLRKAGIRQALVAGGGDIRVGEAPPHEGTWVIASKGRNAALEIVDTQLRLENEAVSTSGDTYRFLEWEGRRYSHIIDPRTGLGLDHRVITTVIGPQATLTDALATALNVLSPDEQKKLRKKFPRYTLARYKQHNDAADYSLEKGSRQ